MASGDSHAPKRSGDDEILDPAKIKYSDAAFQKFEAKWLASKFAEYDFNTVLGRRPMLPLPGQPPGPPPPNPFGEAPFSLFRPARVANVAPIDFIQRAFSRVQRCVRLVWLDRIRDMCVPILRAPVPFKIHEAHCFNLGTMRFINHEEWDPKKDSDDDALEWLFTRMTQEEAIRSMSEGIIPRRACETEERWFCIYLTDHGISDEDVFVLKRLRRHILDQKTGTAVVGFEILAGNEHQVPTSPRDRHGPHCHCLDSLYNHFLYDAKKRFAGLSGRGTCRFPANPAVILANDPLTDWKHHVGCTRSANMKLTGSNTLKEVPRENDKGKPIACGTPVATAIPDHIRSPLGYLKYCMDLARPPNTHAVPSMPLSKPPVLNNADALYIRKDLSPNADPVIDFQ